MTNDKENCPSGKEWGGGVFHYVSYIIWYDLCETILGYIYFGLKEAKFDLL